MRWITNVDDRRLSSRRAINNLGKAVVDYLEQANPGYIGRIDIVYPEPNSGDLAWYLNGRHQNTDDEYLTRMQRDAHSFVAGYLKAKGR